MFRRRVPSSLVMSHPLQLSGQRFGRLIAEERTESDSRGRAVWRCTCDCGATTKVLATHLKRGNTKSCGCYSRDVATSNLPRGLTGPAHHSFRGVGNLSKSHWNSVLRGAVSRGHAVEITIEGAWALYERQKGRCALSGLPIGFGSRPRHANTPTTTASLDRIDSSLGYVEGNVQWVHREVNLMKNTLTQERFLELCQAISECAGGACEVEWA